MVALVTISDQQELWVQGQITIVGNQLFVLFCHIARYAKKSGAFLASGHPTGSNPFHSSRSPLAAILPMFLRLLQFSIPVSLNLLLMPGEHVLRRDVTDSTVQTDVVVTLCVTLPTMELQAESNTVEPAHPEVWPLERGKWEVIIATDEETEGRTPKEACREEITNFA